MEHHVLSPYVSKKERVNEWEIARGGDWVKTRLTEGMRVSEKDRESETIWFSENERWERVSEKEIELDWKRKWIL